MEIQLWREILNPYELAVKEVTTKFNHLIKEHKDKGIYCPIERVEGRVKTIASILDKCQKKKIAPERIEDRIVDLAGIRIICQFVEDIDRVVEIIRNRNDMDVKQERDYIRQMKPSRPLQGIHLIKNNHMIAAVARGLHLADIVALLFDIHVVPDRKSVV